MDGRLTFHMIPMDGDLINPYFTPAEVFKEVSILQ